MLQLRNESPFASGLFLFPNEDGVDTIYVLVKATFDVSGRGPVLSPEQQPVQVADEYFGAPDRSSLKYASEAHLMKPGTDVVVVGDAISPDGRAVCRLDVSLAVGDRTRTIRVWGDRAWTGTGSAARPGEAEPFVRMPVVYERAFGGMQTLSSADGGEAVLSEPRNPVGRGFRGRRSVPSLLAEPVPNLEDPRHPISSLLSEQSPAGFGFVAPWWAPRFEYAGTYDEAWRRTRAPYLPQDFDARFFSAAPAGWLFDAGLDPGTEVRVENMSETGTLAFELPAVDVGVEITVAGRSMTPPSRLETVLLEPNEGRLVMTWRAAAPCDKRALEVSEVRIAG